MRCGSNTNLTSRTWVSIWTWLSNQHRTLSSTCGNDEDVSSGLVLAYCKTCNLYIPELPRREGVQEHSPTPEARQYFCVPSKRNPSPSVTEPLQAVSQRTVARASWLNSPLRHPSCLLVVCSAIRHHQVLGPVRSPPGQPNRDT